jgi:hypothetical protein
MHVPRVGYTVRTPVGGDAAASFSQVPTAFQKPFPEFWNAQEQRDTEFRLLAGGERAEPAVEHDSPQNGRGLLEASVPIDFFEFVRW